MDQTQHDFHELFQQLGLPNDEKSIRKFIASHSLPEHTRLADADFWTPAQAQFLREAWTDDSDWALLMDQLNVSLRH